MSTKLDNPMSMKRLGGRTRAPVFPSPPLKFRTLGFPQYGFKRRVGRDLRLTTYTRPKPSVAGPMALAGKRSSLLTVASPSRGPWLGAGYVVPHVIT